MKKQKELSKGLALTFSAILEGLFFIALVGLLYWFITSRMLEIHIITISSDIERHAINMANVLISYEKLAYIEDGKIQRGVLDSKKLDDLASMKGGTNYLTSKDFILSALTNYKYIDISYPNTITLVTLVDLEDCKSELGCKMWFISLVGPGTIRGLYADKFVSCVAENFKTDAASWIRRLSGCSAGAVTGFVIGSVVPGLGNVLGAAIGCGMGFLSILWEPQDLVKCSINSIPESAKNFFYSGNLASAQGLPVLIRYSDGSIHVGRIIVSVIEWL